jgi:acyl carrier protein
VLVGRSAPTDAAEAALTLLRQRGATISVRALDVADAGAVARLAAEFGNSRPALRGVIHAAGSLDMALLAEQRWESFSNVFRAKIAGAWSLHLATRHLPLDFFLLFSSLSALLGDPGNANYGAANAFLDALACARRSQGLTGLSIDWGAWGEIGMAADAEVLHRIARRGMLTLSVDEGLGAAERALVAGEAQVGVLAVDWPKLLRTTVPTPFLQDFAVTAQAKAPEPAADFRNELESAVLDCRADLLVEHLRAQVARVIGAEDVRTITPERGFFSLGMDSLTSVELRNRLQRSLRVTLPATVAFDYPTVDALAEFLRRDVLPGELFSVEALASALAAASPAAMVLGDVPVTGAEEADEAATARELAELQAVLSRDN